MGQRDLNRASQDMGFKVEEVGMEQVAIFKYLGRPVTQDNDDWMTVYHNLAAARQKWGRIRASITKEISSRKTMENFYKAVVQAILLYGSESWYLTTTMLSKLNTFHHQCARHICRTHIMPISGSPGQWICPSSISILSRIGLRPIQEYIEVRRQNLRHRANSISVTLPACLQLRQAKPLSWWKLS